ncbi:unnamed protein product [Lupinus luteus]|uniref:RING-type domain-containing protein n=1 Tax=Lupinus luteus TaxID=3873 RepID=A0AAV1XCC3_LUPLU
MEQHQWDCTSILLNTVKRTISEAAQAAITNESPRVHGKNTPRSLNSPKTLSNSNPSSPRTPLKLSLFKNSFKFRSSCGICLNSVKTGQGTAIYTAECSHAFHFPCIAAHVRKRGSLVCPVCNATWKDVTLLAPHKNLGPESATQNDVVATENASAISKTKYVESIQQQQQKHVSDSIRLYDDDEPLLSPTSDERAQTGSKSNQRKNTSHVSSTRFAHIEIPVQSFGFGRTQTGQEDVFAKCVSGILSVVVQDLRIQLGFQADSSKAEISAIYTCSGRPTLLSSGAVRLGDLYAEEERELLLELRVPASAFRNGTHHLMMVRCLYKDPATKEIIYGKEQGLVVPSPQSNRSNRIERLRNLFITARAIAESRRLVEHNGDLNSASHLLASTRALLVQFDSNLVEEYVRGLEAELAEVHWRRQNQEKREEVERKDREMALVDENGEPLTPTSAWRAAEKLAKMAMIKKSLNRVSDLHGFENARF